MEQVSEIISILSLSGVVAPLSVAPFELEGICRRALFNLLGLYDTDEEFVILTGVFAGVGGWTGVLDPELVPDAEGDTWNPIISLTESGSFLAALSWRKIPSAFFRESSKWIASVMSLIC